MSDDDFCLATNMMNDDESCLENQQWFERAKCSPQEVNRYCQFPTEIFEIVSRYEHLTDEEIQFNISHIEQCENDCCFEYRTNTRNAWKKCNLCDNYVGKWSTYDNFECENCHNVVCRGSSIGAGPRTGCTESCDNCGQDFCVDCYDNHCSDCV